MIDPTLTQTPQALPLDILFMNYVLGQNLMYKYFLTYYSPRHFWLNSHKTSTENGCVCPFSGYISHLCLNKLGATLYILSELGCYELILQKTLHCGGVERSTSWICTSGNSPSGELLATNWTSQDSVVLRVTFHL